MLCHSHCVLMYTISQSLCGCYVTLFFLLFVLLLYSRKVSVVSACFEEALGVGIPCQILVI